LLKATNRITACAPQFENQPETRWIGLGEDAMPDTHLANSRDCFEAASDDSVGMATHERLRHAFRPLACLA